MTVRRLRFYLAPTAMIGCGMALAQGTSPTGGEVLNPMRTIPKESLKAFLEAPLFDPSRRKSVDVAPTAIVALPQVEEPPPALHLLGIIHGDRDIAMVRRDDPPAMTMLATGDHVGSWEVTVLPTTGVRLRNGKRAFDYVIFTKGTGGTGPIAVQAQGESQADDAGSTK